MKLVIALILTALPFYCYAGSGCASLETVIDKLIDPEVNQTQLIQDLQPFISGETIEKALMLFKECFLDQDDSTLNNFRNMMEAMYNSRQCAEY